MIRLLAVQHTFPEFLGALEPQFEARDIAFTYLRPVTGQDVFARPSQFDSLWLLGGAWPVGDTEHCPCVGGEVRLVPAVAPLVVDDCGRWLALRPSPRAFALLFRPELEPGMIEDMIMEDDRPVPDDIGEVLDEARRSRPETQQTTARHRRAGRDPRTDGRGTQGADDHPAHREGRRVTHAAQGTS
jgi:hypothetical protein